MTAIGSRSTRPATDVLRDRAYYEAHRDEIAAKQRAYYEAHRDEIAAKQRAYYEAVRNGARLAPSRWHCLECGEPLRRQTDDELCGFCRQGISA